MDFLFFFVPVALVAAGYLRPGLTQPLSAVQSRASGVSLESACCAGC